jgi:N-acetylmuramoyl-L-alanine amidase
MQVTFGKISSEIMKRIITTAIAVSLFTAGINAGHVKVSVEGKKRGAVEAVKYKNHLYLHAKKAARLFHGSLYWQPKSGKVVLSVKRFRAVFEIGSKKYFANGKSTFFSNAVLKYKNKIFIPLEFFTGKYFSDAVGKDVSYDDLSNTLEISKKYNVGEMEYFSFGNLSRVSFALKGKSKYSYEKKSNRHIQVFIPGAVAKKTDRTDFKKGAIRSVRVRQLSGNVLISVLLSGRVKALDVSVESGNLIVSASSGSTIAKAYIPSKVKTEKEKVPLRDASDSSVEEFTPEQKPSAISAAGSKGEIILDFSKDDQKPTPSFDSSVGDTLNIPDSSLSSNKGRKIIVIKDSGGVSKKGFSEKNVNLSIAKIIAGYLKKHKGIKIVLTRSKDIFVSLGKRSAYSNKNKADLFVSIHANSHRDTSQNGFEVFVMSEKASDPWAASVADLENSVKQYESEKFVTSADILLHSLAKNEYINDSLALAGLITKNVVSSVPLKKRQVKKANFHVLRGTYSPSVLVETGFVTNSRDRKILSASSYRKKIATAIYKSILSYGKLKGWNF